MTSQYKTKKAKSDLSRRGLEQVLADIDHIREKVDKICSRMDDHYALLREIWQSINKHVGVNSYDYR